MPLELAPAACKVTSLWLYDGEAFTGSRLCVEGSGTLSLGTIPDNHCTPYACTVGLSWASSVRSVINGTGQWGALRGYAWPLIQWAEVIQPDAAMQTLNRDGKTASEVQLY